MIDPQLGHWLSAGAFRSSVKSQLRNVNSTDFFSREGKRLREALLPDGSQRSIEITEALMPDRRRQHEFEAAESAPVRHIDEDEFKRRRSTIPIQLSSVINKKISKRYPADTDLLVYSNIGTFDWWREEIEIQLEQCAFKAIHSFSTIWVLWSGRLYEFNCSRIGRSRFTG